MRWTQDDAAETRRLHVFSVHNDTLTAPELETVSSLLQNTKYPRDTAGGTDFYMKWMEVPQQAVFQLGIQISLAEQQRLVFTSYVFATFFHLPSYQ